MMHAYEKEINKRELLVPAFSYPYQVIPLTEQAKISFALYNKQQGPLERIPDLIKNHLNVERPPFVGELKFYYEDTKETEQFRKEMTKDHAIKTMAGRKVRGISHKKVGHSIYAPLIEGKDYTIEIGEKIKHKQPKQLSFKDIKAL